MNTERLYNIYLTQDAMLKAATRGKVEMFTASIGVDMGKSRNVDIVRRLAGEGVTQFLENDGTLERFQGLSASVSNVTMFANTWFGGHDVGKFQDRRIALDALLTALPGDKVVVIEEDLDRVIHGVIGHSVSYAIRVGIFPLEDAQL